MSLENCPPICSIPLNRSSIAPGKPAIIVNAYIACKIMNAKMAPPILPKSLVGAGACMGAGYIGAPGC